MKELVKIKKEKSYSKMDWIKKLIKKYPEMKYIRDDIINTILLMKKSISDGGKILTAGNGGSACNAENIVGELMKGFRIKRNLTDKQIAEIRTVYPKDAQLMSENLQQAIPAISLVSGVAFSTAYNNDKDPEFVYAQKVYGLGRTNDVFIGISTSGNSKNIINAAKAAKIKGMNVIGMTGYNGGKLNEYCDVCIKAPANNVADIQELHIPIYHCICSIIEYDLFLMGKENDQEKKSKRSLPENIELIVFDFDGVFTDNKVYTDQDGKEIVICDRRDSLGIKSIKKMGIPMFILSTEKNNVVYVRGKKIGLDVNSGCKNKRVFLEKYFSEKSINPDNVVYMGNDLNDMEAMKIVGYPVATNDAHPEIKKNASLVVNADGGNAAVREFCEYVLKAKNK